MNQDQKPMIDSISSRSSLRAALFLNLFKENEYGTSSRYQGKVEFSISEREKRAFSKFFLPKHKAKFFLQAILQEEFERVYPTGASFYGGSLEEELPIFKIMKVVKRESERNRALYEATIEEYQGKRNGAGAIAPIGSPILKVSHFLHETEMLEFAQELYDLIRDTEVAAAIAGKPLVSHFSANAAHQLEEIKEPEPLLSKPAEEMSQEELLDILATATAQLQKRSAGGDFSALENDNK